MIKYYESHITVLETLPRLSIQKSIESVGWKFSAIDGDPVLGKRVYCYATKHRKLDCGDEKMKLELLFVSSILKEMGLAVIRNKVEVVVFDDRQGDCATCPRGVGL